MYRWASRASLSTRGSHTRDPSFSARSQAHGAYCPTIPAAILSLVKAFTSLRSGTKLSGIGRCREKSDSATWFLAVNVTCSLHASLTGASRSVLRAGLDLGVCIRRGRRWQPGYGGLAETGDLAADRLPVGGPHRALRQGSDNTFQEGADDGRAADLSVLAGELT